MRLEPGTAVTAGLALERPLGEGAMGSVWVGRRAGQLAPVAVKFLAAQDRGALSRFAREAAAAARIDSPNVVRILDQGATSDGTPYIVMELLEGETLGHRLERVGRLGLEDASAILRQVANALDAAHRLGVVHRDVKPDNVFLVGEDDFPLVKVLDFGMAKDAAQGNEDELTGTGVAVGTPEYMSPEQVLGGREVDGLSDLWALGVMAYRALAGVPPFDGLSPHALFFAICRGAYRPLAEVGIPAAFDAWFARALSPKKPGRFQSGLELVDAFDRVLAEVRDGDDDAVAPTGLFDASQLSAGMVASIEDRRSFDPTSRPPTSAPASPPRPPTSAPPSSWPFDAVSPPGARSWSEAARPHSTAEASTRATVVSSAPEFGAWGNARSVASSTVVTAGPGEVDAPEPITLSDDSLDVTAPPATPAGDELDFESFEATRVPAMDALRSLASPPDPERDRAAEIARRLAAHGGDGTSTLPIEEDAASEAASAPGGSPSHRTPEPPARPATPSAELTAPSVAGESRAREEVVPSTAASRPRPKLLVAGFVALALLVVVAVLLVARRG